MEDFISDYYMKIDLMVVLVNIISSYKIYDFYRNIKN